MANEMISKPDANPVVLAVCNLLLWGCVGYFMMGQQKKAIAAIVYVFLTAWCGVGLLLICAFAYDAYLLGQKLQRGESIGVNENGLGFLDMLPGFKS